MQEKRLNERCQKDRCQKPGKISKLLRNLRQGKRAIEMLLQEQYPKAQQQDAQGSRKKAPAFATHHKPQQ